MPVMKCSNGEYKIGRDGDCRYSTKEKAESAQQAYYASKNESVDLDEDVRPRTGGVYSSWLEAYNEAVQNYMPDTAEELRKFTSWFLAKNGGGARMHEDRIKAEMEEMIQNMQTGINEGRWQTGPDWVAEYWDFLDRVELYTPGDVEDATSHFLSKNPGARKMADEIEQAMQEKMEEFDDSQLNEDRRNPINTDNFNIFYQQMIQELLNSSPDYKEQVYRELWPLVKGGEISDPRPGIKTDSYYNFQQSMITNFRNPSNAYFYEMVQELWQAIQSNKDANITEDSEEGENDVVSMDHSFLLRILELMREYEDMDDVLLHKVADRIIEKDGTITMDDYDDIIQDLDPEKAGYGSEYSDDEMEEEVLKSPQDWDNGDKGPVTDDPKHKGKHELDELDMLLRWSGQKR